MERAATRDPSINASLADKYIEDEKDTSTAQFLLETKNYKPTALLETNSYREYMAREGV